MGRPQLGFPRLRVVTRRESGVAMSPDDTPPSYGADGIFSGLHEKGPGACPGPASLPGWECVHKSGGGGSEFLDCDLLFRTEPVV